MDDSLIPQLFKLAEKRFHAWTGLLFALLLASAIGYITALILGPPIRSVVDSTLKDLDPKVFAYCEAGFYLLILCFVFLLWFYKRRAPSFGGNKVGILFSTLNPDELTKEVVQLKAKLMEELKRLDLLNFIELKDLPPNRRIEQVQDGISAINAAEGVLLIWGNFQRGQVRGQNHAGFPALNFTYRHPVNVSSQFHEEIGTSLLQRKWTYEERNEFIEKNVVANNIAQVALNIVGLTLLAWGKFDQAEAIFGPLDVSLEPYRTQAIRSPLANFCGMVRRNRVRAIALQLGREFDALLWRRGIYTATPDELERWRRKLGEAIILDSQDSRLFGQEAILNFLCGNIEEALRSAKKAKKCAPRADSNPDFALGFLRFYKGEMQKACAHYRVAFAKKASSELLSIFEIVEFIRQVVERHPEKIHLHYALGRMNEERLDPGIAETEFGRYIQESKSYPQHSRYFEEARQRLENLRTALHADQDTR